MWNSITAEILGFLQSPCLCVSRSFKEGCASLLEWLSSDRNVLLMLRELEPSWGGRRLQRHLKMSSGSAAGQPGAVELFGLEKAFDPCPLYGF